MNIIKTTLLGLFFGTSGTMIGGIIGCTFSKVPKKYLSYILSFASGLMIAVVCFDLILEALKISSITTTLVGIFIGIIMMIICDYIVQNKCNNKVNSLLKTGIIVGIGLAIHNFPEGLAIGSGYDVSIKLGTGLALAICLHDIPEGVSMAAPMKSRRNESKKSTFVCIFIRSCYGNRIINRLTNRQYI